MSHDGVDVKKFSVGSRGEGIVIGKDLILWVASIEVCMAFASQIYSDSAGVVNCFSA